MKMTVELPDDLVKRLKLRALHEGRKLKETATDVVRAGLAARSAGANGRSKLVKKNLPLIKARPIKPPRARRTGDRVVVRKDRRTGIPVIRCPADAPARRMTMDQLRDLENEFQTQEDLERLRIPFRQ